MAEGRRRRLHRTCEVGGADLTTTAKLATPMESEAIKRQHFDIFGCPARSMAEGRRRRLHRTIPPWDSVYHGELFKWAGWVMRSESSNDLAKAVMFHKNWTWIQIVASQNYGRQCHGRMLRTWRWERPLYNYLGDEWWTHALDRDHWLNLVEPFLKWRHLNR